MRYKLHNGGGDTNQVILFLYQSNAPIIVVSKTNSGICTRGASTDNYDILDEDVGALIITSDGDCDSGCEVE
jgi:hypothetical protein